jgi:hypothetical protein
MNYKNNVLVTTTTTGESTLTQGSAVDGFAAPGAGDDGKTFTIMIKAVDASGIPTGAWELCQSVYTHSGTTWSRGTLIESSTGSRIDFASGTKHIGIVAPASVYGAVETTGDTVLFTSLAGRIYNAASPSSGATVTLDFTGAVPGATAMWVSDGTDVTISSSETVFISGEQLLGEQSTLFLLWDGQQVYANWVPSAPAVTQLATPTVALTVGDTELDYTISGEDAEATGGVFEYSVNAGSTWAPVPSYYFLTKSGTITGLTNGVAVSVRLRNTAGGYYDSEYGTDSETPTGDVLVSMVAYYALEDATDSHGSNDLTNNNTATFATGKVSNGVSLVAASSQSLSHADNSDLSMGDIDFTIACWARLTTKPANAMAIVGKYLSTGNQREYLLDWVNTSDRFRFAMSSDGASGTYTEVQATTFGAPSTGTWYFLVAQYDATTNTMSISVNNGTPNTVSQTGGAFNGTANFYVGASQAGASTLLNGGVDELGVWKRKLTAGELTAMYNAGAGKTYPLT